MLRHTSELLGLPSNLKSTASVTNVISNPSTGSTTSSGSPLDALPKQFVFSMKTLFDILDDQHTGFVRFADIEKGWQDDGCKGLPRGVLDSLRKVTPASGLLSFERFCAGLKLCLLRNQSEEGNQSGQAYKSPGKQGTPLLDMENPRLWAGPNPTAAIRPQFSTKQRTLSMPQLSPDSELDAELRSTDVGIFNSPPPPPKPPRAAAVAAANAANGTGGGILTTVAGNTPSTGSLRKAEIRSALQNWQMGILFNEMDSKDKQHKPSAYLCPQHFSYRGCADGGSSSTTDSINSSMAMLNKKSASKRREPRRHTLQNGIDYNMLKRLKQYEEEREVLFLGLDAVEKARDWYLQQLANVQEKIKYLGRMGHVEQWSEVQQERLNFQRARVLEVNRNLAALADTWERGGLPLHFNLAIRTPNKSSLQRIASSTAGNGALLPSSTERLRQQNHYLTSEVNLKNDRIALLEREKEALLMELQQRMGLTGGRPMEFVLSQSSPGCSSSSGGLGDADVVY